jgi:hypothetical protein
MAHPHKMKPVFQQEYSGEDIKEDQRNLVSVVFHNFI